MDKKYFLSVIQCYFNDEVQNKTIIKNGKILVSLPNNKNAKVRLLKYDEKHEQKNETKESDYVLDHDFGYGEYEVKDLKKILLRSVNDVRTYINDVIRNAFLDCELKNFFIKIR